MNNKTYNTQQQKNNQVSQKLCKIGDDSSQHRETRYLAFTKSTMRDR